MKWLKHRSWVAFPLLGAFALGSALLLSGLLNGQPQPAPLLGTASPAAPTVAPTVSTPIASKSSPLPTPSASPSASSTSSASPSASASPSPEPQPSLTAEQQAMNQQAKAAFESSLASVDSLIPMQVAIAKAAPSLTLSVSATADLIDRDQHHLGTLSANTSYTASANGETISVGDYEVASPLWIEPALGSVFTLGNRTYRGRLLLAANESHLWGVNVVDLRQYLYSVVASEVSPSWPPEALKAQAVAARSYALTYYFKPVNSLYQLGDDEYFQVYTGVEKEAEATNKAVDETAGEFVSYRGGIVESLYAASDDIVADAFQGKGMSQLGALGLAEQGYTYQQILANYYPGTGVGRIQQDYE